VSWGAFQHETLVVVGGAAAIIAKRYENSLLFTPPEDATEEKGCHNAYAVEVLIESLN
jgi:hypothetical protein